MPLRVGAIDTHAVIQELKSAGFTEAQAEAVVRVVRNAQDVDLSNLATKNDLAITKAELQLNLAELKVDLAEVKAELQRDMAELRAEVQRDLAATKTKLLKWVIGSIGVQTIVILGAMITLIRTMSH